MLRPARIPFGWSKPDCSWIGRQETRRSLSENVYKKSMNKRYNKIIYMSSVFFILFCDSAVMTSHIFTRRKGYRIHDHQFGKLFG